MEIAAVIAVWAAVMVMVWATYNNLVAKRNQVENAYGALDAMLRKRYELLPNLLKIVKAYTINQQNVLLSLMALAEKRQQETISTSEKHEIDSKTGISLSAIIKQLQELPELKSDTQFSRLQGAWNEAEEQIAAARRAYNSAVTEYNNAYESFPGNTMAKNLKFVHKEVLETPVEERANISPDALMV